jgi:hypothetical protein
MLLTPLAAGLSPVLEQTLRTMFLGRACAPRSHSDFQRRTVSIVGPRPHFPVAPKSAHSVRLQSRCSSLHSLRLPRLRRGVGRPKTRGTPSCPYKDPEKQREADRRWRAANPEKACEANRRWREANPQKGREQSRRRREANLEKARTREAAYTAANRVARRAYMADYRASQKDATRLYAREATLARTPKAAPR